MTAQMRQFLGYCSVGVVSNGICYAVFLVLIWQGVVPVAATALCYALGVAIAYIGNHFWAFRSDASHVEDVPRFLIAYGGGLVASMGFMWLLLRWLRPELAQIVTMGATAVVIFTLLKVTGFGRGKGGHVRQN